MKMRNPKLLGLIRKGCSITFPSGVIFYRVPESEFIETGIRDESLYGVIDRQKYELDEYGLELALEDEELYAANLEDDEKLETEELEEEMP